MSNVSKAEKFNYLFKLLCEFDDYCRQHDISLILDRGTLIGAVRHRGFIPWDFDLDVSISWNDYLKLLQAWEKDPLPNRELVNWDRFPMATTFWLRYVDTTTTELRRSNAWGIVPTGMSLDVFFLIPVQEDPKIMQEVSSSYLVYYELMNRLHLNKRARDEATTALLRETLEQLKTTGDRKSITDALRAKALSCVDDTDFAYYYLTTAGLRTLQYYRREYVDDLTELPFEGRKFFVPAKYIEHTRTEYGPSWRYFPDGTPPEYEYIENLRIPYQVYEHDYLRTVDQAEVIQDFIQSKDYELDDVLSRLQVSAPMYQVAFEKLAWHLERYGSPEQYSLADLSDDLRELLKEITKLQLSGKVRYWQIWFGVDDAWLSFMFELLWQEDDYHAAQRLLDFRVSGDLQPLSETLKEQKVRLENILELYDAIDYRDADRVKAALGCLRAEEIAEKAVADEARLLIMRAEVEQTHNYQALEQMADRCAIAFPDSLEILSYHAYARACQGDVQTALQEYEEIERSSNNGMLLLAIKDDRERVIHD